MLWKCLIRLKVPVSVFLLLSCSFQWTFAQSCFSTELRIESQADVDIFAINHPTCTSVIGDLIIIDTASAPNITDLSGLGQLLSVGISYNTALTHRKNLLHKLGAKNSAGLIVKGFLFGLLEPAKFEIA